MMAFLPIHAQIAASIGDHFLHKDLLELLEHKPIHCECVCSPTRVGPTCAKNLTSRGKYDDGRLERSTTLLHSLEGGVEDGPSGAEQG